MGRVQQAEVAYFMEPLGQDMLEQAPQKLHSRQQHGFPFPGGGMLILEGHLVVVHGENAVVGDGNPVDIAAQICQHLFRFFKGRPGKDAPVMVPDLFGKNFLGERLARPFHEHGPKDRRERLDRRAIA